MTWTRFFDVLGATIALSLLLTIAVGAGVVGQTLYAEYYWPKPVTLDTLMGSDQAEYWVRTLRPVPLHGPVSDEFADFGNMASYTRRRDQDVSGRDYGGRTHLTLRRWIVDEVAAVMAERNKLARELEAERVLAPKETDQ